MSEKTKGRTNKEWAEWLRAEADECEYFNNPTAEDTAMAMRIGADAIESLTALRAAVKEHLECGVCGRKGFIMVLNPDYFPGDVPIGCPLTEEDKLHGTYKIEVDCDCIEKLHKLIGPAKDA